MHCLLPADKDGTLNCVKIDDVVMIGASKRLATPDSDWQVTICLTGGAEKSLIGLTENQAKDAVLAFYEASRVANDTH